jgi:hypothetical protein
MTVQPEGEDLRKASRGISDERSYDPSERRSHLIEQACAKFDLSPKDAEFLMRFFAEKDTGENV